MEKGPLAMATLLAHMSQGSMNLPPAGSGYHCGDDTSRASTLTKNDQVRRKKKNKARKQARKKNRKR